jgi:hypothetical protein
VAIAARRFKGPRMSRLRDVHEKWLDEPAYREEYERLDPEFELARALIEARAGAGLTQAELTLRVQPTAATLQRLARATGTRLKIAFEPADPEH